jgi:integrase
MNGRRGGKMGKRGNGEGSITWRKDGLYMARYTVQTATGSKRKTLYGKTRREVDEKLTKAKADRDGGLVFDADNLQLGEYLERWLVDSVRVTRYVPQPLSGMSRSSASTYAPCWVR